MFLFIMFSMLPSTRVKVALSRASTFKVPLAVTVACLGLEVIKAISPKYVPVSKVATSVPLIEHLATPKCALQFDSNKVNSSVQQAHLHLAIWAIEIIIVR